MSQNAQANVICHFSHSAVASVREKTCTKCDHLKLTAPRGYISSYKAQTTKCGSPDCPWLLEAQPGQRLNISLINFAWTTPERGQAFGTNCKVFATLKEASGTRGETVCGKNVRERHVYTSLTNAVELRIVGNVKSEQFLLYYEGQ